MLVIKEGMTYRYKKTGNSMDSVENILEFIEKTHDTDARISPLAAIPHIPQWFTTHDFIGTDGKTYPGATY